jgi:ADP-ribosylglycohydrolase
MVITLSERARGALIGLAVGDALGGPTEGKTPEQIASRWGRITDFLTDDQGGSDDTEYALFNARVLLRKGRNVSSEDFAEAWRNDIINADNRHKGGGFSEMLTIENLLAGLHPPASGQHLHSWSDGLAMRVAPFGIISPGDPHAAAHLAFLDGCVSNSGEGIFGGQAVAAGVAEAMYGGTVDRIIRAALEVLPEDSWTAVSIKRGVRIGVSAKDVWSALRPLYDAVACHYYFWTDIAPEAVGLAFGVVAAARGNFEEAVLGAVNLGRDTDTIAAIAGALCGAAGGIQVIPERWAQRISSVQGRCIGTVKGMDIRTTADELSVLAESWRNRS